MRLINKNILIISNEPWSDIWYSKQNYAYELSKQNNVYFINPADRWQPNNLLRNKITVRQISSSLHIINYHNPLPSINVPLFRLNNSIVSNRLKKALAKRNVTEPIVWTFDPVRLYSPQKLNASFSIFHSVDKYDFKHMGEKYLSRRSDVILCVARSFVEIYKPYNPSSYFIPHGISSEEFDLHGPSPNDIPKGNYGLYIGMIDYRLDFSFIEEMVKRFPEVPFVFVGKKNLPAGNQAAHRLFTNALYPNVKVLGVRPFKQLKHYIAPALFCLAPMDVSIPGNNISHHKIFQYMALGKPVFSCEFSEYTDFAQLLYMDNNKARLLSRLENYLTHGEDISLSGQRSLYAKQFTFEELLSQIEQLIEGEQTKIATKAY